MTVHFNLFNLLQKFFGFAKIKWSKIDRTACSSVEASLKKHINAFEELKNDEKNSRELLNSIFEVASKSLKSHLNDFEVKIVFRPIILYFLYFLLCYYNN